VYFMVSHSLPFNINPKLFFIIDLILWLITFDLLCPLLKKSRAHLFQPFDIFSALVKLLCSPRKTTGSYGRGADKIIVKREAKLDTIISRLYF